MGFLKKAETEELAECRLCGNEFPSSRIDDDYEICDVCLVKLMAKVKILSERIPEYQILANSQTDPNKRIMYLKLILNLLYEYKVLFADNDVNAIQQDVDDLIDEVIDCISEAKM